MFFLFLKSDISHGVKRSNSSQHEDNNQCKLAKTKHLENSNPCTSAVFTEIREININVKANTSTAAAQSTQISPPSKLIKDVQTT